MTDIPQWAAQKACDLLNAEDGDGKWRVTAHSNYPAVRALARLIAKTMPEPGTTPVDELAAFKREVSEALTEYFHEDYRRKQGNKVEALSRFILPEPVDPLDAITDELLAMDQTTRVIIKTALRRGMDLAEVAPVREVGHD